MRKVSDSLWALLEPVVVSMGYEFVGAQFGMAENGQTLRVYIDNADGIVVDDCATVSRQLSALLDVEDVIDSEYLLEVSSPGLDRPLFGAVHFRQFAGEQIKVKLLHLQNNRRNFKGVLVGVIDDSNIEIDVDGEVFNVPIDAIESAKLQPEY